MLDSDSGADVGQRQVVVEDLPAQRDSDDVPGDETAAQNEEPTETDSADSAPGLAVEPQRGDWLTPLRQR